jgi:hypothetical protein
MQSEHWSHDGDGHILDAENRLVCSMTSLSGRASENSDLRNADLIVTAVNDLADRKAMLRRILELLPPDFSALTEDELRERSNEVRCLVFDMLNPPKVRNLDMLKPSKG